MQESCTCPKWIFCFPFDLWTQVVQLTLFILPGPTESWDWSLPLLYFQHRWKKQQGWIGPEEKKKKIQKNKHEEGALWVPLRSQPQSWSRGGKQKGMFQSAPTLSFPITSWTWPCRVHKALIFLLTAGDCSTGSWAEKMCSRRSPRQGGRENKQQAPWCHFYSHFCDSSHTFLYMALSKQFRANVFLAVGRGCSFQHRQTQCKGKQRTENRMAHYYLSSSNYTYYSGGDRTNKCGAQCQ